MIDPNTGDATFKGSAQITGTWPLVKRDTRWLPYWEWKKQARGGK